MGGQAKWEEARAFQEEKMVDLKVMRQEGSWHIEQGYWARTVQGQVGKWHEAEDRGPFLRSTWDTWAAWVTCPCSFGMSSRLRYLPCPLHAMIWPGLLCSMCSRCKKMEG